MRQISLNFVPTAILSRQVAVVRKSSLIINLPGQPRAIQETLEGVRDKTGEIKVPGIFAAVPYGLELIGGPLLLLTKMFASHLDLKINDYDFVNLVTFARHSLFLYFEAPLPNELCEKSLNLF